MAREQKAAEVAEVRDRFTGSAATLLTHYRGLGVKDLSALRADLRKVDAELRVVKNTLARRAVVEAGASDLGDLLEGPTGLVFCGTDPVGPAKALKAFAKDHPELEVRGGWLDGAVLDAASALRLADLASREELLAKLAGLMQGALSGMARLLQAPLAHQARLIQALIDRGGAPGAPASAPAPAPVAAAEPEAAAEEPAPTAAAEPEAEATEA